MLTEIVIVRILFYVGSWFIIKGITIPIFLFILPYCYSSQNYNGIDGVKGNFQELLKKGDRDRVENLSRLLRSQLYCLFASMSGIYVLITEYHHWPMDLLHHWSSNNQFLFEIAISHWIFSIIEDRRANQEVISHMIVDPREKPSLFISFLNGLYVHHVVTIFAYTWSLYSQYLSALCIFGLCFETPVLLMNIRDICVSFEKELLYPISPTYKSRVMILWSFMSLFWHITRTSFCMLWPISIIFWRRQLVTVPLGSRVVYHLLGIIFNFVNFMIPHTVLRRYVFEDQERIGVITKKIRYQKMKFYGLSVLDLGDPVESSTSGSASGSANGLSNGVNDLDNQESQLKDDKDLKLDTRLLGIKEVNAHNSSDNAWILIDKDIYDITSFLSKHPGGREILLEYLGQDATKAFHSVGHSLKAQKMLEPMKVGRLLNHSYSQSSDMKDLSHVLAGDINKPYEVGKIYYSFEDPIAFSYVFPFLSIIFTSALYRELIFTTLKRFNVTSSLQSIESSSSSLSSTTSLEDSLFQSIPHFNINQIEVYQIETSFLQLMHASIVSITPLLILALMWALVLNYFSSSLRNINEYLLSWIPIGSPLKSSQLLSSLSSFKSHLTAVILLISLTLDWMIYSCGIISSHSNSIGLRAIRNSLLLTFGFELMIRKLFFYSSLTEISSPFPGNIPLNLLYNHGAYMSIILSVFIEMFSLFSFNNSYFQKDLQLFLLPSDSSKYFPELTALLWAIILSAIIKSILARAISSFQTSPKHLNHLSSSDLFHSMLSVLLLSSFYGILYGFFFTTRTTNGNEHIYSKPTLLDLFFLESDKSFDEEVSLMLLIAFVSLCLVLSILSFAVFIHWSTSHFATQVMCLLPAIFLWYVAPPMGSLPQYLCLVLTLLGLYCVSLEGQLTLTVSAAHAAKTNTPISCPHWIHCAKQLENLTRHIIAYTIHSVITRNLVALSSIIAPDSQKYWTSPLPVMDLGPNCDYGMAYQISGKPQKKPGVFQCNIGYIGSHTETDFFATAGSTLKMMKSLIDDPEAGNNGFISDIVAQFNLEEPSLGYQMGKYSLREVNLNVWENESSAMDWYKKNDSHKEVVKMYYNGGLSSFSAMIASLPVSKDHPIRWDVRCRNCRMMVQGPDPKLCPYCHEKMLPMPYV